MSKYSRVSNSEDVQEVELQVPSYEEATSIVNNNGSLGEFSILNKIKRKPNNNNNSGGGGAPHSTDGVFSNLSAKPETEAEKEEENPPPYEAAAADATPPYWETTIIAPGLMGDEVLVEGLPVGNFFISMSFQFVGFLLTYLLHTSHAAKAGLGITLVQYGFYLRGKSLQDAEYYNYSDDDSDKDGLAKNEWLR
ncbi:22512_t:CDS:2 [Entrophospora sp. SA101]|nr:14767_t:CDS:2 [Entrophospora sp. SA101]CAJ0753809.1 1221_t:CDS:2 [Entrophospora sp. SA101]CAJ0766938.1 22512_t:CDS:2 [Entrophospora sp. SA101]CAJ0908828.1 2848_t:CDS:2 [Entrophospora sp. SA101]